MTEILMAFKSWMLSGYVLVSIHKEVREALAEAGIPFCVCYPTRECKYEYIARYKGRGSPAAFVELLEKRWDAWISELEAEDRAYTHIMLPSGTFIGDVVRSSLLCSLLETWFQGKPIPKQ